jgi:hypothetical protein
MLHTLPADFTKIATDSSDQITKRYFMKQLLATATFCLLSFSALADWKLDNQQSSLSFVSVKNGAVVERHTFKELAGTVNGAGQASLEVNLDSVATLIPIRNERMREMLFNTKKHPLATANIQLDKAIIDQLATSSRARRIEVSADLTLNATSQRVNAALLVNATTDGGVMVSTAEPILISAAQWDLNGGIEALREVAGLNSITQMVPVTFTLKFVPASTQSATAPSASAPQTKTLPQE